MDFSVQGRAPNGLLVMRRTIRHTQLVANVNEGTFENIELPVNLAEQQGFEIWHVGLEVTHRGFDPNQLTAPEQIGWAVLTTRNADDIVVDDTSGFQPTIQMGGAGTIALVEFNFVFSLNTAGTETTGVAVYTRGTSIIGSSPVVVVDRNIAAGAVQRGGSTVGNVTEIDAVIVGRPTKLTTAQFLSALSSQEPVL